MVKKFQKPEMSTDLVTNQNKFNLLRVTYIASKFCSVIPQGINKLMLDIHHMNFQVHSHSHYFRNISFQIFI